MNILKYLFNVLVIYSIISYYNIVIANSLVGNGNFSVSIVNICYIDTESYVPLNFGTVKYKANGTATVNANGTTSVTGNVTSVTGASPGTVNINCSGNANVTMLANIYCLNGSEADCILRSTSAEGATTSEQQISLTNLHSDLQNGSVNIVNGSASFHVGGTISVNSNNVAGAYEGYYKVDVEFN